MNARNPGPVAQSIPADAAAGARTVLPVIIGAIPFALVLGALAAKKGLTPVEIGLMSSLVFAGAAQFAAVELWTTPATVGALGLTALLINLRHVVMGIALAPHLRGFGRGTVLVSLFVMADEVWALAMRRSMDVRLTPAFYLGMGSVLWLNWVVFSVAGAVAGAVIDDPIAYGFDFAFVAIFMALLKSFWAGWRTAAVWAASALAALAAWRLIEGPWYVLAGALAGMVVAAAMAQPESETP